MPLARESLMLDIAQVGDTFVVVGDRGHVLISEDQGRSWIQKRTPTRVPLTGVWFHDRNLGWAVGHDAVILRTEDGGETWCRCTSAPELERPLFDVWFEDAQNGFAVGAYGYFLRSSRRRPELARGAARGARSSRAPMTTGRSPTTRLRDDELDDDGAWDDDEWRTTARRRPAPEPDRPRPRPAVPDGRGGHRVPFRRPGAPGWRWTRPTTARSSARWRPTIGRCWCSGCAATCSAPGTRARPGAVDHPVDTSLFGGARLPDGGVIVVGTAGVMLVSREGDRFRLVQRADRKALMGAMPPATARSSSSASPACSARSRRAGGVANVSPQAIPDHHRRSRT
jgi:hypothetical protein